MFVAFEGNVHPDHLDQERRLFIVEGIAPDRYEYLISSVMSVYAAVTDKKYSHSHIVEYPAHIVGEIEEHHCFDFRFGIPKLEEPARTHGKFSGRATRACLGGMIFKAVGFWVDTNDSDALHPRPEPSRELVKEFDAALQIVADAEFADIVAPTAYRLDSQTSHHLDRAVPTFR